MIEVRPVTTEPLVIPKIETYCFSYEFTVKASNYDDALDTAAGHLILKDWSEVTKNPAGHLLCTDIIDDSDDDEDYEVEF